MLPGVSLEASCKGENDLESDNLEAELLEADQDKARKTLAIHSCSCPLAASLGSIKVQTNF